MPFTIVRNDITKMSTDAIVNTANPLPVVGGGTDRAVYRAAGEKELLDERRKIGRISLEEAAITRAYRLQAKYIIHTVGPVWVSQLREFTMLNSQTGKFQVVPEYPEFAWQEGIVNVVTHREYAMSGSYIKVSMYDDRLEIESPGKLPNIVTVANIRDTTLTRIFSLNFK